MIGDLAPGLGSKWQSHGPTAHSFPAVRRWNARQSMLSLYIAEKPEKEALTCH